jgi:serine/threonine-protein phosphatase 5
LEGGKYGITSQFIRDMMVWFKDGKTLPRRYVWEIVLGAYSHFVNEETLVTLDITDGVTCDVIGDVHGPLIYQYSFGIPSKVAPGQYYDVLRLFSMTGEPTDTHCLLMNGDLVDRGSWSVEVILTAFAYKCKGYHPSILWPESDTFEQGYGRSRSTSTGAITKPKI